MIFNQNVLTGQEYWVCQLAYGKPTKISRLIEPCLANKTFTKLKSLRK